MKAEEAHQADVESLDLTTEDVDRDRVRCTDDIPPQLRGRFALR